MTTFASEQQFQDTIIALLKMLGLKYYHPYRSTSSVEGWLDLTIVGRRGVIFRELKTATGKVTDEQSRWVAALREAGQDADVWRPVDWPERIQSELRALGRSSFAGEAPSTQLRRAKRKVAGPRRNARSSDG